MSNEISGDSEAAYAARAAATKKGIYETGQEIGETYIIASARDSGARADGLQVDAPPPQMVYDAGDPAGTPLRVIKSTPVAPLPGEALVVPTTLPEQVMIPRPTSNDPQAIEQAAQAAVKRFMQAMLGGGQPVAVPQVSLNQPMQAPSPAAEPGARPRVQVDFHLPGMVLPVLYHDVFLTGQNPQDQDVLPCLVTVWDTTSDAAPPPRLAITEPDTTVKVEIKGKVLEVAFCGISFVYGVSRFTIFNVVTPVG